MFDNQFFTPSGVRFRQTKDARHPCEINWLLLPGGPGIGSESLHELAAVLDVPGSVWLVDLPEDGSNVAPPITSDRPSDRFANWPDVLIEAALALPNCVFVGHSTGGMYLLSVPELEKHLAGLVLISSAPDASWFPLFVDMTQRHPLPAIDQATAAFEANRTNERLRDIAMASAEWNFTPTGLDAGRDLLSRMPYNLEAVDWSDRNFDHIYVAKWWPGTLPTLILSGQEDHIVAQHLWDAPRFQGPNVLHKKIPNAAHFVWIDQPEAVRAVFARFAQLIGQ